MRASDARLLRLAREQTRNMLPELRRAYLAGVRQLAREIGETATEAAVRSLRVETIVTDAMLDRAFLEMRVSIRRQVEYGVRVNFGTLPSATPGVPLSAAASAAARTGGISLGVLNPRVREAVQTIEAWVLPNLRNTTRETVRRVIEDGILEGVNPRALVPRIKDTVGLAPSHVEHVANFRRRLESVHRQRDWPKAFQNELRNRRDDGKLWNALHKREPLSRAEVERMTAAYRDRYKRWHAETIARTTSLNAQRSARDAATRSAVDAGLMPAGRITKRWVTNIDGREREAHEEMNGVIVRLDEPFIVPGVGAQMLPGESEYKCRCTVAYEIEPLPRAR